MVTGMAHPPQWRIGQLSSNWNRAFPLIALFVLRKIPAGDVKFCELKSIWIASGSSESREFFTAKSYMSERYIAIEAKSV